MLVVFLKKLGGVFFETTLWSKLGRRSLVAFRSANMVPILRVQRLPNDVL